MSENPLGVVRFPGLAGLARGVVLVEADEQIGQVAADGLGAQERGQRLTVLGGKFVRIELWFGDSAVMLADEFPEWQICSPQTVGGTSTVLNLFTQDVELLWQQAISAGAQVFHPLEDAFWRDRHGQITDPFGHRWGLAQHVRDVPSEEVARLAAHVFGRREEEEG